MTDVACGNIRFSSLFAAGDVSAAKSEEKRMFSQAMTDVVPLSAFLSTMVLSRDNLLLFECL